MCLILFPNAEFFLPNVQKNDTSVKIYERREIVNGELFSERVTQMGEFFVSLINKFQKLLIKQVGFKLFSKEDRL
jgi:hypothetical protein